jgi:glucosamine kinase
VTSSTYRTASLQENTELYLGIDGGGSKCRSQLRNAQCRILGTGLSGPANPVYSFTQALESILDATRQSLREAGLSDETMANTVAGIALAGLHIPQLAKTLSEWQHPFKALYITTDLHAACLGAHQGRDGAVIIAGTGSCGYCSVNGQHITLGGYGFLLGDQGSGARLGIEAVRAALLALDELGPQTLLLDILRDHFQCEGMLLVEHLMNAKPRDYASLTPLIFSAAEAKDAVATALIESAASYISDLAMKLQQHKPPRLSLMGGLAVPLTPWLDQTVTDLLSPPLENAETGSIYFAMREHKKNVTTA